MTEPLPNWRSICPSAVSSACSRSIRLPTSYAPEGQRFEYLIACPGGAERRTVERRPDDTELAQLRRGRSEPRPLAEAQHGDVREPWAPLAPVDAEALEPLADAGRDRGRCPVDVVQDDHAHAPRLAVPATAEPDRSSRRRRGGGELAHDRGHLRQGPGAEERKRDVQVLRRDDATLRQV